jgi:hypothetical protein
MINALGNWIDPSNITAVSAVEGCPQESEYFFIITFKHGGAIEIESDSAVEIDDAHDTVMQAWDTAVQRECLEEQFKRGLEREEAHGVTLSVNMPADTPSHTIKQAINQASKAVLDRVDDMDESAKLARFRKFIPRDSVLGQLLGKEYFDRVDDVGGGV